MATDGNKTLIELLFYALLVAAVVNHASAGSYINIGEPTIYCREHTNGCTREIGVLANPIFSQKSALTFMPQRLGLCLYNDSALLLENYDRTIAGDRLTRTSIKMDFGVPMAQRKVCEQTFNSEEELEFLGKAIEQEFLHNLWVDDLPVLWCYRTLSHILYCTHGMPVGCHIDSGSQKKGYCLSPQFSKPDTYYIYNHFVFTIHYEPTTLGSPQSNGGDGIAGKIVQITVSPESQKIGTGGFPEPMQISAKPFSKKVTISFTFEVTWKESEVSWNERWTSIFFQKNTNILLLSAINTVIVTVFVCILVLLVVLRTHPRFIKLDSCLKKYNEKFTLRQSWRIDEDAWKELEQDVFRTPAGSLMLAALCGNAAQLFCTVLAVLVGGAIGLLVPANPGQLVKWTMWGYGVSGVAAGFVSLHALEYIRRLKKENEKCCTPCFVYLRSWLISGLLFGLYLCLNLVHWEKESSSALDLWSLSTIFLLMVCLPVPCTVLGGWLSFCCLRISANPVHHEAKKADDPPPPPPIPKQPCYLSSVVLLLVEGILPFSAIFIPAVFALKSVWAVQYYYMSGALIIILFATVTTGVCTACYICFLQLCKRNYKWWWRQLLPGVGMAVYYFLYAIHFFVNKTAMRDSASVVLYFGYNLIIAILLFLLIGPLCFVGTCFFVRCIYYHLSLTRRQEVHPVMDGKDTVTGYHDDGKELLQEDTDLTSLSNDGWDTLEDSGQVIGQRV